jgi:amino acid transporter
MRLPFRFFPRPSLSPADEALRQRRQIVKFAGLVVLASGGAAFLGFVLVAAPGRLGGGEIGIIAALVGALFGSRLVSIVRRIGSYRRPR